MSDEPRQDVGMRDLLFVLLIGAVGLFAFASWNWWDARKEEARMLERDAMYQRGNALERLEAMSAREREAMLIVEMQEAARARAAD